MPIRRSPMTQFLAARLRLGIPPKTAVYVGSVPPGAKYPYIVLRGIDGGDEDTAGSLDDATNLPTWVYQVDSVGSTYQQCEDVADAAKLAVLALAGQAASDDITVCGILPDGAPGGVEVTGTAPREVYAQQSRYAVTATGA